MITLVVTLQLKHAIDQSSILISSEFTELNIVEETQPIPEIKPA